jgi:hypothetical protein
MDCLDTPQIQAELRDAAKRSILHAGYQRRPGWQEDFNIFAMALSLAAESIVCPRVFHELDGAYTSWPWKYMARPERMYARFRRRARARHLSAATALARPLPATPLRTAR